MRVTAFSSVILPLLLTSLSCTDAFRPKILTAQTKNANKEKAHISHDEEIIDPVSFFENNQENFLVTSLQLRGGSNSSSTCSSDTIQNYVEQVSARDQAAQDSSSSTQQNILPKPKENDSDDESQVKLKKKENAVGDPSDSDDDALSDSSDDELGPIIIETTGAGGGDGDAPEIDVEVMEMIDTQDGGEEESNVDEDTIDDDDDAMDMSPDAVLDRALIDAFRSMVINSPPKNLVEKLSSSLTSLDVASRRRLDRRILYESLMLELDNVPINKRRYLDKDVVRAVKGALSLACQPQWRKHMDGDWYCRGLRFYETEEEKEDSESSNGMQQNQYMDEEEEEENEEKEVVESTLSMQETVALAFAHSLRCGMVLLDDVTLEGVKQALINNPSLGFQESSNELRYVNLINHLIRLANKGKLKNGMSGKISDRMERDIALGLDDPFDNHAVESLKMMRDDEKSWMEEIPKNDDSPLPLVLFLRTDASHNLLKSKSFVDRIARECVNEDSIHMLVLGKGIDATTVKLPFESTSSLTSVNTQRPSIMSPRNNGPNNMFLPPNNNMAPNMPSMPNLPNMQQPQNHNPFASMSNVPPGAMPNMGMNMNGQNGQSQNAFGFSQQNINASGVNDPEGSRRFNIFLARIVEKDGNAGIMGAIAPPQAGNLFPQMLAMQARENFMKSQRDGDSEEEQQKCETEMMKWKELMEQSEMNLDSSLPPQFFSASIQQEGANGPEHVGENPFQNMIPPPPEMIQQAIEHAVNDVMQRLSEMTKSGSNSKDSVAPNEMTRAFAQVLSNHNLRRGIAENLARAAPALVDPRCQGVMLSVYVPPPPNHPNHGLMPGQKRSPSKKQGKKNNEGKSNTTSAGVGGWLNKILSSTSSSTTQGDSSDKQIEELDDGESEDEDEEESIKESNDSIDQDKLHDTLSKTASKKLRKRDRQARAAAVAAAAAMINDHNQNSQKNNDSNSQRPNQLSSEQKIQKHLTRLQALCKSLPLNSPTDPVRSRAWNAWATREKGAIIFRKNRRALNRELDDRCLEINDQAGTRGMGSVLRQMLSAKDVSSEIEAVVTSAIEIEAAKCQLSRNTKPKNGTKKLDPSLHQLIMSNISETQSVQKEKIHPKSLEKALSLICHISSSPNGESMIGNLQSVVNRSREEITELAQDKHERALISQVVSPQDIGVNYDMIGGLGDVKELLRQSITYPLKYPQLYSEGIAKEAVKGVLLVCTIIFLIKF